MLAMCDLVAFCVCLRFGEVNSVVQFNCLRICEKLWKFCFHLKFELLVVEVLMFGEFVPLNWLIFIVDRILEDEWLRCLSKAY